MKTTTIADAKNQLSNLIHQLENGEPVHLTRYGKPVAVMMSENQYQKLVKPQKSLHTAIQDWREKHAGICNSTQHTDNETGWDAEQLKKIRQEKP
jgi:prevent-host-death family protein